MFHNKRNKYILPRSPMQEIVIYWGGILLEGAGFVLLIGTAFALCTVFAAAMGKL